jgi:8-oxo-dGTP pyrophosphatase MutT (NUDIX family)
MSHLDINFITDAVEAYQPGHTHVRNNSRQAAVAAILKPEKKDTEVLFIQRATKEGDPWSGHMAFPGGHKDEEDGNLRHTAERETWEEIGLDLNQHGRYVGQIDSVRANPQGRKIDMIVTPFVYVLETPGVNLAPNVEVADIHWGSLSDMFHGRCLAQEEFEVGGQRQSYPGYSVGDQVVWGLTLRMLEQMFSMLDPGFGNRSV